MLWHNFAYIFEVFSSGDNKVSESSIKILFWKLCENINNKFCYNKLTSGVSIPMSVTPIL